MFSMLHYTPPTTTTRKRSVVRAQRSVVGRSRSKDLLIGRLTILVLRVASNNKSQIIWNFVAFCKTFDIALLTSSSRIENNLRKSSVEDLKLKSIFIWCKQWSFSIPTLINI